MFCNILYFAVFCIMKYFVFAVFFILQFAFHFSSPLANCSSFALLRAASFSRFAFLFLGVISSVARGKNYISQFQPKLFLPPGLQLHLALRGSFCFEPQQCHQQSDKLGLVWIPELESILPESDFKKSSFFSSNVKRDWGPARREGDHLPEAGNRAN